jgi:hypothetical protein
LVDNIVDDAVLYYGILGYCYADGSHRAVEAIDEKITEKSILYGKSCTSQPGSFYKSETLQKVGYLDENLNFVMDTDLWLKLLRNGKAKFVPHIMAYLRAHDESKSCNKKISDIRESQQTHIKHGGSYLSFQYLRGLYAIYKNFFKKKYQ